MWEASAAPQCHPSLAEHGRHGCMALCGQSRVPYPSQCVHHQLGIAHIGTTMPYPHQYWVQPGTTFSGIPYSAQHVHHQLGITHRCFTMPSPRQGIQPGRTPHGIATCMMVALRPGQGVRHQPMGAWSRQIDITLCTITAGFSRNHQKTWLSPWLALW